MLIKIEMKLKSTYILTFKVVMVCQLDDVFLWIFFYLCKITNHSCRQDNTTHLHPHFQLNFDVQVMLIIGDLKRGGG
jgi:hypothetical protein